MPLEGKKIADESLGGNVYECAVLDELEDVSLRQVIIYRPDAHLAWDYYWLNLIHLRPTELKGEAVKLFHNSTHEVAVFAMHPEHEPDPDARGQHCLLSPPNLVRQLRELTDGQARKVFSEFVRAIADSRMNPDSDFRKAQGAMLLHLTSIAHKWNN